MAKQKMTLDPAVTALTDDQIAAAVNAATTKISSSALAAGAAKANLDAMADTDRGYIQTVPVAGQLKVLSLQRDAAGKLEVSYDDGL